MQQQNSFLKKGQGALAYSGYEKATTQNLQRKNSIRLAHGLSEVRPFLRQGEGKMAWHASRDVSGEESENVIVPTETSDGYLCIIC